MQSLLRKIPKVDEVMKHERWRELLRLHPQETAKNALRATLDDLRLNIKEKKLAAVPAIEHIIEEAARRATELSRPGLRRVINGTGVVIHTNLGRSILAKPVIDALINIASNYSNLEYDLTRGKRGDRYEHCSSILRRLTGCEASLVVNNNAAAVLLVLDTFAQGKEVVIGRGELIEIGGSFRIPDVMRKSGAILKEVGTTNRTFVEDFERALNENTGLLMKAHTSNYRIRGFVHEATIQELIELGKKHRVPVFYDAGSGLMYPFKEGRPFDEPVITDLTRSGLDILSFSADKLLGGPQGGIILGKAAYINALKQNPLVRAMRPDKFTLAALEATLFLYADEERRSQIPTLEMIHEDEASLKRRASRIAVAARKHSALVSVSVVRLTGEVGGGSLPDVALPSYGLALEPRNISLTTFEEKLRMLETPIIARIGHDRLLIDVRTVRKADEPLLASGIAAALSDGT